MSQIIQHNAVVWGSSRCGPHDAGRAEQGPSEEVQQAMRAGERREGRDQYGGKNLVKSGLNPQTRPWSGESLVTEITGGQEEWRDTINIF